MQIYEPRQVRKEAAVSRHLHVPLESWILLRSSLSFVILILDFREIIGLFFAPPAAFISTIEKRGGVAGPQNLKSKF